MATFTMSFALPAQMYEQYTKNGKDIRNRMRMFLNEVLDDELETERRLKMAKPLTPEQERVLQDLSSDQIQKWYNDHTPL